MERGWLRFSKTSWVWQYVCENFASIAGGVWSSTETRAGQRDWSRSGKWEETLPPCYVSGLLVLPWGGGGAGTAVRTVGEVLWQLRRAVSQKLGWKGGKETPWPPTVVATPVYWATRRTRWGSLWQPRLWCVLLEEAACVWPGGNVKGGKAKVTQLFKNWGWVKRLLKKI